MRYIHVLYIQVCMYVCIEQTPEGAWRGEKSLASYGAKHSVNMLSLFHKCENNQ